MGAGPPLGNKNAEKWTLEESTTLFENAIVLSNAMDRIKINRENVDAYKYDFIGEVARELDTFHHIFKHLVKQFPDLKPLHIKLLNNLESNCYFNTKKGNIREATGIVNLKSNHKWTDRIDTTTKDEPINDIKLSSDQIGKLIEGL